MKKFKQLIKNESGEAELVEALFIYPIVFLIIFLMIYLGLYILQTVTVGAYAQKVAVLTAREISTPGYWTMISSDKYSDSAIELNTTAEGLSVNTSKLGTTDCKVIYRYLKPGTDVVLTKDNKEYYAGILEKMVADHSVLAGEAHGKLTAKVTCTNKFLSQFVTAEVEQELMHFDFLDFFGIESPTIKGVAVATVSDTDELIRNTDFVVDAMGALASKFGIDISNLSSTVNKALKDLKLIE